LRRDRDRYTGGSYRLQAGDRVLEDHQLGANTTIYFGAPTTLERCHVHGRAGREVAETVGKGPAGYLVQLLPTRLVAHGGKL